MRGFYKFNFPAFDLAATHARSLGWDVVNPADLDREAGDTEYMKPHHSFTPGELRKIIGRDMTALLSLVAEAGDAIAMLPGWEASKGAYAEKAVAEWLGLRVLDASLFEPLENRSPLPLQYQLCSPYNCY